MIVSKTSGNTLYSGGGFTECLYLYLPQKTKQEEWMNTRYELLRVCSKGYACVGYQARILGGGVIELDLKILQ